MQLPGALVVELVLVVVELVVVVVTLVVVLVVEVDTLDVDVVELRVVDVEMVLDVVVVIGKHAGDVPCNSIPVPVQEYTVGAPSYK